jgi:hypothetical protein
MRWEVLVREVLKVVVVQDVDVVVKWEHDLAVKE